MSYIRSKRFGKRVYDYLVEGYRDEKGKVRQRVLKYLGPHNKREVSVEPELAGQLAQTLMSGKLTPSEMRKTLKKLGVPVGPGKIKEVSLHYKPPLRKLTLRVL